MGQGKTNSIIKRWKKWSNGYVTANLPLFPAKFMLHRSAVNDNNVSTTVDLWIRFQLQIERMLSQLDNGQMINGLVVPKGGKVISACELTAR